MYMRTKRIIAKCEQHSGYGAGAGDTEYYEYECPCGKGTIIEEHDNIPGFREHSVYLHCTTCSKEYIIDTSAGTRKLEDRAKEGKPDENSTVYLSSSYRKL